MADIDSLSDELGIPWEHAKDVAFTPSIPYIGFQWDIENKTVYIPEDKKAKYLMAIRSWEAHRTHTLEDVQRLHGKLMHACYIVPMGRAYLTSLQTFLGIFHNRPFLPRSPPKRTSEDLEWWRALFCRPKIERSIPGPAIVHDLSAFSDASSETGVGIIIGERWRAWRLLPGWKDEGRDIGWAEALGFFFLAQTLLSSSDTKPCYRVYGDNRGVVEGWWKGHSGNRPTNEIFKLIHTACDQAHTLLVTRYVRSGLNPADGPSRGRYPPHSLLLPAVPIPQQWRDFLVDFDAPLSLSELRAARMGRSPQPQPKPPHDQAHLLSINAHLHTSERIAEELLAQTESW
jgi:hypothetical protein